VTLARLSDASGLDLVAYRPEHVDGRIRRALDREGVADDTGLARLLRRDPDARSRFRRSVAISMSGLFRDREQFELLERSVLPGLLEARPRLSVWSAGCADGSELYSVALLLDRLGALPGSTLLGSDVLEENLVRARAGRYRDTAMSTSVRARVRWELRDLVREGAPRGPWHLVLCRNVAIYLGASAKHSLHESLAGALARGGVLLLGRSERLSRPRALGLTRIGPNLYRKDAA
jgi:chemotaxis protein methyltransferase CheR